MTTIPPDGGSVPAIPKPTNLILIKGQPEMGDGKAVFGVWPSGYSRRITAAEYILWGSPDIDYVIPTGRDDEYNQLAAYDKATRA